MKRISRDAIQRMVGGISSSSSSFSSSGGGGGGGVSQYWVDDNYVSKEFFNRLFEIHDENGDPILPNDVETEIDNIQAMFGFWTNAYLSALGNNPGGGGAELTLASLADVDVHGVANGQALVYDAYTQKWVPGQAGLDPTSLWQELGSLGTEQISSTHLTTALSTYNPTNNFKTINGYSIIGSGNIDASGGGTGNYLPLAGGTMTGRIYFNFYGAKFKFPQWYIGDNQNSDYYLYSGSAIDFNLYTNGAQRMTVKSNGNVGFGTNSPTFPFVLYNSSNDWGACFVSSTARVIASSGAGYGLAVDCTSSSSSIFAFQVRYANDSYFSGGSIGLIVKCDGNVGINTSTPSCKLDVNGVSKTQYLLFKNYQNNKNAGYVGRGGASNNNIFLTAYEGNSLTFQTNGTAIAMFIDTSQRVGIGTTSPSYKLTVSGDVYATGGVTALSDARHKTIIKDTDIQVDDIARMSAVVYRWNDGREDNDLHVGSIAQDWQRILPEVVMRANDKEGTLSMQYGVAALVSSIITARKVVDHERRIAELERENKKLKQQLNAA